MRLLGYLVFPIVGTKRSDGFYILFLKAFKFIRLLPFSVHLVRSGNAPSVAMSLQGMCSGQKYSVFSLSRVYAVPFGYRYRGGCDAWWWCLLSGEVPRGKPS